MSDIWASPNVFFSHDHHACDELWAKVEAAIDAGDASDVSEQFRSYDRAMRRHFAMEEEVLFPALAEEAGESSSVMLQIMTGEHEQMRKVLDQIATQVDGGAMEEVLDNGDTLLMLIQQHNVKEEGGVYYAADVRLSEQWPALRERLRSYVG